MDQDRRRDPRTRTPKKRKDTSFTRH
jgi:hypothetical protein